MSAKLDPDHNVAIWATRYCLGRMTYDVGQCVEWLIHVWPDLRKDVRAIIQRDIEEAFAEDARARDGLPGNSKRLGMDMDRREWERVRRLWGAP